MKGLFGTFDHDIRFPTVREGDSSSSVAILHGPNGVGKTTILRMLDGFLRSRREAAWDVFRTIPFESCSLYISDLPPLTVQQAKDVERQDALAFTFGQNQHYTHKEIRHRLGPSGRAPRDIFPEFHRASGELSFEFIEAARIHRSQVPEEYPQVAYLALSDSLMQQMPRDTVAERMRGFISAAQANYRAYFADSEPDLFTKIMSRLNSPQRSLPQASDLLKRLRAIQSRDINHRRLGLEPDRWDYNQLEAIISQKAVGSGARSRTALAVASQYVEVLESRSAERELIAARLTTFERIMAEFLLNKTVRVDPQSGLAIESRTRAQLEEQDLSSGERHLLYLMVSAVVTRRRGTVVAIDEPEMSMHIAWQRQLIPALLECAANAEPQFILATHSPDLAAGYPQSLIPIG